MKSKVFPSDRSYSIKDSPDNNPDELHFIPISTPRTRPSIVPCVIVYWMAFPGLAVLKPRRAQRTVNRQAFDVTRMSRVRIVSNCFRFACQRRYATHGAVNYAWSRFANQSERFLWCTRRCIGVSATRDYWHKSSLRNIVSKILFTDVIEYEISHLPYLKQDSRYIYFLKERCNAKRAILQLLSLWRALKLSPKQRKG